MASSERQSRLAQALDGAGDRLAGGDGRSLDDGAGQHDVALPQPFAARRQRIGQPGQRREGVAHDVAAAALALADARHDGDGAEAGEVEGTDALLAALARRAREHAATPCVGRSHGIHAEPTTFGLKLAGHYAEFRRARRRLETAREEIAVCAISGPVGTFATVDARVEAHVAARLGLAVEPISTQVVPRDRHAAFFAALAVVASSVERLAVEIRHLQRSEVGEVEERFADGQKGSSAMPHKRNPVLSENLTGLARLVRATVVPALENVALWHERDISHSSVERNIAPDATIGLDFALARLAGVIDGLVVHPEAMKANLERLGGLVFSQRVLLALVEAGASREEAYRLVQASAMTAWRESGSFEARLKADPEAVRLLSESGIEALFDYAFYTRRAAAAIERAFEA